MKKIILALFLVSAGVLVWANRNTNPSKDLPNTNLATYFVEMPTTLEIEDADLRTEIMSIDGINAAAVNRGSGLISISYLLDSEGPNQFNSLMAKYNIDMKQMDYAEYGKGGSCPVHKIGFLSWLFD